ncbi:MULTISPECIES: CobW-like GTP-binding protein [unclassified Pseudomonas]|uniref:CobW family GTP-binding protein n=1 Tax=unclassified Pseudomonas TaxID=196821 RepID=UPI000D347C70|nr:MULTISPECIES: CobW-like GTP-binding protein [unclassified Pseudomonas]RAU48564.1 cobalamin biosynthesis protein CobW [Pseudomonas sp. RIT 409]RAU54176.1 cobalamin biosynthesis protein CobW [Pseudomonas sp. RIT 412]
MLQNIPTHVIAGPLGAGKTTLIKHLLSQKPGNERWAILINEFGRIGLDAALLTTAEDGIALGEVAGGCLCCVNGAPFQIGLGRLLRKAQPDRLFIEPSGLGHPAQLMAQLREAPWRGVLAVQPSVIVLDSQALAAGTPLPPAQRDAAQDAGLLVLNKSAALDDVNKRAVLGMLPDRPIWWAEAGVVPLDRLPGRDHRATEGVDSLVMPRSLAQLPAVWSDPLEPICLSQRQVEGWSIGWRWHPDRSFDASKVQAWLRSLDWRRAKLLIHSQKGWVSGNALAGSEVQFTTSEWRKDSRLELIFDEPQDEGALSAQIRACLV